MEGTNSLPSHTTENDMSKKTMTTQELSNWLNDAAGYMKALASCPAEGTGDEFEAEVRENTALYNAAFALQQAANQLSHLRANGVQQEIIVVKSR